MHMLKEENMTRKERYMLKEEKIVKDIKLKLLRKERRKKRRKRKRKRHKIKPPR